MAKEIQKKGELSSTLCLLVPDRPVDLCLLVPDRPVDLCLLVPDRLVDVQASLQCRRKEVCL